MLSTCRRSWPAFSGHTKRHERRQAAHYPGYLTQVGDDRAIGEIALRVLFKRISTAMNMRVTPHMLRHTFATLCRQDDVPDRLAMELLGHASLSMLQRYSHVEDGESVSRGAARPPRCASLKCCERRHLGFDQGKLGGISCYGHRALAVTLPRALRSRNHCRGARSQRETVCGNRESRGGSRERDIKFFAIETGGIPAEKNRVIEF